MGGYGVLTQRINYGSIFPVCCLRRRRGNGTLKRSVLLFPEIILTSFKCESEPRYKSTTASQDLKLFASDNSISAWLAIKEPEMLGKTCPDFEISVSLEPVKIAYAGQDSRSLSETLSVPGDATFSKRPADSELENPRKRVAVRYPFPSNRTQVG